MDKREFIQKAIDRGVTDKAQLKALVERAEERGVFGAQAQSAPAPAPEQGGGYFKSVAQPSIDYGQRLQERAERVQRPTITEKLIPGQSTWEQAAAVPERAIRMAGGAVESLGEIPVGAISTINKALGGVPGKALGMLGRGAAAVTPEPVKEGVGRGLGAIIQKYQGLPQEVKNTAAPLGSLLSAVPVTKLGQKGLGALSKSKALKAVSNKADDALEVVEQSISRKLKSQAGEIVIPDIDKTDELAEIGLKTSKQIKSELPKVPKKPMLSGMDDAEAILLSEATPEGVTPFTQYAQDALEAKRLKYKGVSSPMDKAGTKAVKASQEISKVKNQIGKELGGIIDEAHELSIATNQFIDTRGIKETFYNELENTVGINARNGIKEAADRGIRDPGSIGLVKKLNTTMNSLPDEATVKQVNDAMAAVRSTIDRERASQLKPVFSQAETVAVSAENNMLNAIDDFFANTIAKEADYYGNKQLQNVSEKYAKARQNYQNIKKIDSQLNRRLGEIVDPATGQARMGASLLKSALMSNSDRGSKALFRAVKDVTGIDLLTEAGYAEIAMKAVGDPRINDLLAEVGSLASATGSLARGDVVGAGSKAMGKVLRGSDENKIYKLIDYYNKAQLKSKAPKAPTAESLRRLNLGGR